MASDQFTFPSGHVIKQLPIEEGIITVDLKNGGMGKDDIFEYITSKDSLSKKQG